jgi:uncharacterized protein
MTNALEQESSPYLRQHAENPVDWLPWGPTALARAHSLERPLLVSIGYSACHWCHVMERESFEDPEVAALMNASFVCVKVDREERPDVDALYMDAVQGMTGHGGWPLNVFLTPEQLPFYGGTYFPPKPRGGMPSWTEVLTAVADSWRERPQEIRAAGEQIRARLGAGALLRPTSTQLDAAALELALANLRDSYDPRNGGFGGAPKFPPSSALEFLLVRARQPAAAPTLGVAPTPDATQASDAARASEATHPTAGEMALDTLRAIATGGIHDQVGGGIHRYAVDATWTVPHFEKMLYDNALLARAFLHAWQLSEEPLMRRTCEATCDWVLRELSAPEGGFYSALDADSEGVEGKFYVWSVAELQGELDADAQAAIQWLGASERGNFSEEGLPAGANVLQARGPEPPAEQRERIRARLLAARERRVRPGLDDKRLTSWNALMLGALAECGAALQLPRYLDAAVRCAEFIQRDLRDEHGLLLRTYGGGGSERASIDAYLEDHAFLLEALLALFEASCDERWFTQAVAVAEELIERFADPEHGGFFSTAADAEALVVRRKDLEDTPIPSGSSSAALGLLRLSELTGETEYERHALSVLALLGDIPARHPGSFAHALQALHWHSSPMRPIACPVPSTTGTNATDGTDAGPH